MGVVDLRDRKFGIVDGKGAFPNDIRLVPRRHGATESTAGQVLEINPAGIASGYKLYRLDQGVEDVIQAFLA
jgi:hypothetical protein